jgi:hypothetical protein
MKFKTDEQRKAIFANLKLPTLAELKTGVRKLYPEPFIPRAAIRDIKIVTSPETWKQVSAEITPTVRKAVASVPLQIGSGFTHLGEMIEPPRAAVKPNTHLRPFPAPFPPSYSEPMIQPSMIPQPFEVRLPIPGGGIRIATETPLPKTEFITMTRPLGDTGLSEATILPTRLSPGERSKLMRASERKLVGGYTPPGVVKTISAPVLEGESEWTPQGMVSRPWNISKRYASGESLPDIYGLSRQEEFLASAGPYRVPGTNLVLSKPELISWQ